MVLSAVLADNSMNFNENPQGNAILDMLRSQRNNGRFCDIILHVSSPAHQEKLFPAHRSVLAACSQYFESVLKTHRITKENINIVCHNLDVFETLLDYMYTGNISVDWNNVNELLKLSTHFLMTKVINYCAEFLEHYLALDNCFSVKDLVEKYNLENMIKTTNEFICENLIDIIEQPLMLEMSGKKLESIINDEALGFHSIPPSQLLTFLVCWLKKDVPRRLNDFAKLIDVIDWNKMKLEFIYDHIDTDSIYQENKICLYFTLKSLVQQGIKIDKYKNVFEELKKTYENHIIINEESENEMIVAQSLTDGEMEDFQQNSPIYVEPLEVSNFAKNKGRKQTKSSPSKRSSKTIKNESSNAENETSELESESNGPRTRKRNLRQKYSKNEWVTFTSNNRSNKKKNQINEKEKMTDEQINESEDKSFENEKELNSEFEGTETNDDVSHDGDELDDESFRKKKYKQNFTKNRIQTATLAHWKQGIKCPHCIYVGHSATRLEQHLSRVHEEDTTYKCKMCSFVCKWNREYYKHMKSHFEGPPYKCEDCNYTCDRIQFILSHRMRHTDERPFHCERCDFKSRTKGNLIVHMRIHTGEKPYKCPQCGRCFAMKNTLDQHMATHRDDRPYLCEECPFTTKYQSHLLSHKRIHTGNVFTCEQPGCNYFSPRRSQLAAHMRSHFSIRSHMCSTCGRAFIEKSHLIRHERIHLAEKPFKCDQCDYGSTRRDKLKEHIIKHHSGEGHSKSPYKPRKPRRQSQNQTTGYIIDSQEQDDNSQSQLIVSATSPHDVHLSQPLDQELCTATASLIYEYPGGLTVSPARVVIQPAVSYSNEEKTIVESIVESQAGDNSSARVVIQSIPSTSTYSTNNQSVDHNSPNSAKIDGSNSNELGGLHAFMALF